MVHDTNGDDGVETTPISRRTTYLYMGTSIGSDMSESLGFWIMMGMVNIMRDVKKQLFYHDDRCAYVLITIAKQCKLYDIGMDVFFSLLDPDRVFGDVGHFGQMPSDGTGVVLKKEMFHILSETSVCWP
jgi:hypothetical protein